MTNTDKEMINKLIDDHSVAGLLSNIVIVCLDRAIGIIDTGGSDTDASAYMEAAEKIHNCSVGV